MSIFQSSKGNVRSGACALAAKLEKPRGCHGGAAADTVALTLWTWEDASSASPWHVSLDKPFLFQASVCPAVK